MDEWVVRAGIADLPRLMAGYVRHLGYPNQQIFGCSVQYQPGLSVDELAKAGQFPNGQISFVQRLDLEAALTSLGYHIELRSTKGMGFHHTLMVLYNDATKAPLTTLPIDAAQAMAGIFQRKKNPFPMSRP
jgi:hypothetical protein